MFVVKNNEQLKQWEKHVLDDSLVSLITMSVKYQTNYFISRTMGSRKVFDFRNQSVHRNLTDQCVHITVKLYVVIFEQPVDVQSNWSFIDSQYRQGKAKGVP